MLRTQSTVGRHYIGLKLDRYDKLEYSKSDYHFLMPNTKARLLRGVFLQAVDLLLTAGADIEAGNSQGETPLHIMVNRKRLACAVALLSHGADVNALGMDNETPLHMAVKVNAKTLKFETCAF